jgi:hypothetical protein
MKIFHASNQQQMNQLEIEVNEWLAALPAATEIFAVNTTSSARDAGNVPTTTITVWYYE